MDSTMDWTNCEWMISNSELTILLPVLRSHHLPTFKMASSTKAVQTFGKKKARLLFHSKRIHDYRY